MGDEGHLTPCKQNPACSRSVLAQVLRRAGETQVCSRIRRRWRPRTAGLRTPGAAGLFFAWAHGQLETKVVQAGPGVAKASCLNDMVAKLGIEPTDSRMLSGRDAATLCARRRTTGECAKQALSGCGGPLADVKCKTVFVSIAKFHRASTSSSGWDVALRPRQPRLDSWCAQFPPPFFEEACVADVRCLCQTRERSAYPEQSGAVVSVSGS